MYLHLYYLSLFIYRLSYDRWKIHFHSALFISVSLFTSLSQICVGVLIVKPAHNIWALFESTLLFQQLGLKTNIIPLVYACQSPYINANADTNKPSILVTPHKHMQVMHTHSDSGCLCFSIYFSCSIKWKESMSHWNLWYGRKSQAVVDANRALQMSWVWSIRVQHWRCMHDSVHPSGIVIHCLQCVNMCV